MLVSQGIVWGVGGLAVITTGNGSLLHASLKVESSSISECFIVFTYTSIDISNFSMKPNGLGNRTAILFFKSLPV